MNNAINRVELERKICIWLREHLGLGPQIKLTLATRINMDLGVDGGDGDDLLRDFSRRFGVDPAKIPSHTFFGPEAGPSPIGLISRLQAWIGGHRAGLTPLYVNDLVEWAYKSGRSAN